MAKKQLNTTAIANELEYSAFFPSSSTPPTPPTAPPASSPPIVSNQVEEEYEPVTSSLPTAPAQPSPRKTSSERMNRTVEPNGRTVNREQEPSGSLLDEITQGVKSDRRPTERYSFEIYSDQIPQIEELQYLYKKRTGQKLSASRILREALEAYLRNAFDALKRKK